MPLAPFPRRAIHLDCHTPPGVRDPGRDFDAEAFAATLRAAHVEFVTVFARCNLGFAYYPTRIGVPYPGLKKDLLGGMVQACHRRGIAVAAYFNAGLDHEHAVQHREWVKLNALGQVYGIKLKAVKTPSGYAVEPDAGPHGHFFRRMCLNTGYGRHLLAMTEEVLDRYPVDGLFFDCFTLDPCYGEECVAGMRRAGLDPRDPAQAKAFCWQVTQRFLADVRALLRRRRRALYVCFNGLPYGLQPNKSELEILPTGGWGYDILPAYARYARTLPHPWFMMTGRFQKSWGDLGGLRPEHSLLFDCYNAVANGGGCSVGDHLHPRGRLDPDVYARIGRVFDRLRALDPWTDGARARAEVAVVCPGARHMPCASLGFTGEVSRPLFGAARMLQELKVQFDVVDGFGALDTYRVLVLPDNILLDAPLAARLRRHLAHGGFVISSAWSGLDAAKRVFVLPQYRLTCGGPEPWRPAFFRAAGPLARVVGRRVTTIYRPGVVLRARRGADVLARLHRPYFNHGEWDGRHEHLYTSPDRDAGRPSLARCGSVFHFSFPVFEGYFQDAVVEYREMVGYCLRQALPDPLVRAEGMPSFGQVTLTAQGRRRRLVHLLAYLPELRGQTQVIEEPVVIRNVDVALRRDDLPGARRAYLAPARAALPLRVEDGYLRVTVPEVNGYQLVVFET